MTVANKNYIHEEIKSALNWNVCYYSVRNILSSCVLFGNP
jgi:hypothetical protein